MSRFGFHLPANSLVLQMVAPPVSCNALDLISALVNVGFVLNTLFIWCDAVNLVSCLMHVGLVRMVRFWSRTPRPWPRRVASCVRMLDPLLVRINSTWHRMSLLWPNAPRQDIVDMSIRNSKFVN
jgi:hypothetical protein